MSASMVIKRYGLKPLLRVLLKVLPSNLFEAFYSAAFPVYQFLARVLYLITSIVQLKFLSSEEWDKVRRVRAAMPFSLVGIKGLEATYTEALKTNSAGVVGDFVELGVARGGAASLLGHAAFAQSTPARDLWLFDSFEGLPEPGEKDFSPDGSKTGDHVRPLPPGSCLGTLEEVQKLILEDCGFPQDKVHFVRGWFEETVPATKNEIKQIALLRIDGDWYESTKVCLENLYPKVSTGGVIVIDDYFSCHGCKLAVDEYMEAKCIGAKIQEDGRGGCYFVKP